MDHTGCDVHDNFCVFQHMSEDGALGLSKTVATNRDSILAFLDKLDNLTTLTMEAGREYWWLYQLFESHPIISLTNVVDPRRSEKLSTELSVQAGYGRARNDRIDAEMLAEQTRRGLAPIIYVPTEAQLELRLWTRLRVTLMVEITRAKNRVHAILAFFGVKLSAKDLFESTDSITTRKALQQMPQFAQEIVRLFLQQIRLLEKQIPLCDKELERLLPEEHPLMVILLTVPGIGPVLARIILAEILDIGYFRAPRYLISYGGLAPIEESSADKRGVVKLNRHCNHWLKYALVEAAHHASTHPRYRRKYEQDVKRLGKQLAKLNLARRLVKAIYWMLTRQEPFRD